mmetsp:Transcript_15545/g.49604  ORF Transcript_15545/g.49604 Transcript_15545/m.49604 type:complete len:209 (+) Transcript_15545:661-1287(+)
MSGAICALFARPYSSASRQRSFASRATRALGWSRMMIGRSWCHLLNSHVLPAQSMTACTCTMILEHQLRRCRNDATESPRSSPHDRLCGAAGSQSRSWAEPVRLRALMLCCALQSGSVRGWHVTGTRSLLAAWEASWRLLHGAPRTWTAVSSSGSFLAMTRTRRIRGVHCPSRLASATRGMHWSRMRMPWLLSEAAPVRLVRLHWRGA